MRINYQLTLFYLTETAHGLIQKHLLLLQRLDLPLQFLLLQFELLNEFVLRLDKVIRVIVNILVRASDGVLLRHIFLVSALQAHELLCLCAVDFDVLVWVHAAKNSAQLILRLLRRHPLLMIHHFHLLDLLI